jgi:hypothetical protein
MTGILSPAVPASGSVLVNTGVTGTSAAAGIVVAIGHSGAAGLKTTSQPLPQILSGATYSV